MPTKIYIVVPVLTFNQSSFNKFINTNLFINNNKDISIFLKVKTPISYTDPNVTIHVQDDNSIYEAWNQSIIEISRKEKDNRFYIAFCGIDDVLNGNFMTKGQQILDSRYDIIFGDIIVDIRNNKHKKYANPNSSMLRNSKEKCWDIFHPGMLMNSRLFDQMLFDLKYKLSADFKFFAWASNNIQIRSKYIPLSQCTININGISNRNNARETYLQEFRKIENELKIKVSGYNWFIEYTKLLILKSPFANVIRTLYWSLK